MLKNAIVLLFLFYIAAPAAYAFQWNECTFSITDSAENTGPKQPTGYKLYIDDGTDETAVDLGYNLEYPCDDIFTIYDAGDYSATATAYNTAGESPKSDPQVPFTIEAAPTEAPSAPSGLNVQIKTITLR